MLYYLIFLPYYYIILYYIILYYIILYYIILYYIILYFIILYYIILYYIILYYIILYYIILYYIILYYTIFYYILLYSILFYSFLFYSILFYSILFYSILFYYIIFYYIILYYIILYYIILYYITLHYITLLFVVRRMELYIPAFVRFSQRSWKRLRAAKYLSILTHNLLSRCWTSLRGLQLQVSCPSVQTNAFRSHVVWESLSPFGLQATWCSQPYAWVLQLPPLCRRCLIDLLIRESLLFQTFPFQR